MEQKIVKHKNYTEMEGTQKIASKMERTKNCRSKMEGSIQNIKRKKFFSNKNLPEQSTVEQYIHTHTYICGCIYTHV